MGVSKNKSKSILDKWDKEKKKYGDIHALWHSFCDYMKKWYYDMAPNWTIKGDDLVQTEREYKHFNINKVVGYKSISKIERFISKNPAIARVVCDDSAHCGSRIYLIPHENKREYWGTTVLFIPQCTKEQNNFFLYPNHLNNLIKELQKIQKRQKTKKYRR